MFKIDYEENGIQRQPIYSNDVKDVVQILINIVNDEKTEQEAYEWCCNAHWGDNFVNQKYKFTISCVYDEKHVLKPEVKVLNSKEQKVVLDKIYKYTKVKYKKEKALTNIHVWNIEIGLSSIEYHTNSGMWYLEIVGSNGEHILPVYNTVDINIFIKEAINIINILKTERPYEFHYMLRGIADRITYETGVTNEWIGEDNGSLTIDFAYGTSYMKNNGGKGLYFALNDTKGKELTGIVEADRTKFIDKVIRALKTYTKSGEMKSISNKSKKSMRNDNIVKAMIDAEAYKKEVHFRIYDDGCWWVDIERHPYGQIRFWVGFEDKRGGRCRASLVSIAWLNDKELRYSTDGIIMKEAVWNKIQSTAKALIKQGILKID